jgi:3-hydroxy-9,10-secoandrosta-1,3,5(10)-triene-9,17-dione monooxygenase
MGTSVFGVEVDSDLVGRAEKLRPLLAANATRTESERQVVPEVMAGLEESGLFEVMVPERVGGCGASMATQLAVSAELGQACPSTAWVQSIINVTTWANSRTQSGTELFQHSDGQRPRMAGVIAPSGEARPTVGGYLVTGKWPFASGSFHASWFSGGVLVMNDEGDVADIGIALMSKDDFTIDDTWHVAGMCGTASNTVVAESVFVPSGRLSSINDQEPFGDAPSDLWPLGSVLSLVLTGPLLGAARACADTVCDKAPTKAISYTTYGSNIDSMVAVARTAEARLDIDSAWMHAFQAAAYIDAVGHGQAADYLDAARVRGQIGYLTALLRKGVDTLLNVFGAASFANVSTVQRNWRDVNVGSRHAFLATNVSLETYGRAMFGLDPVVVIV